MRHYYNIYCHGCQIRYSLYVSEGCAQQKPGEYEGCPLASLLPPHAGACVQLLRKPVSTKVCLFEEVRYNRASMDTVAIVTDSGACMPAELVNKLHIQVVPFLLI